MTEETSNIVLEHLRHIRGRIDGLNDDMRQVILKKRLERVERRLELTDS
jgi:hypothetical protein